MLKDRRQNKVGQFMGTLRVGARAPLRLGFAGGGTDVEPYASIYGGQILNATINRYIYAYLERSDEGIVKFSATDRDISWTGSPDDIDQVPPDLRLHAAVYRRVKAQFLAGAPLNVSLSTIADVPPGSGLGTSSTLVVAMVQAFTEMLSLPLGEYEIAHLAYEIERIDCGLNGGKQDQYAATFGGFNFMEFSAHDRVIVNPLRVRESFLFELESSLVLYFGGVSRESAQIIDDQQRKVIEENAEAIAATHIVRMQAVHMKDAVLRGDLDAFAKALQDGWNAKRHMAADISNSAIEESYRRASEAGATAGKVSGAGGGGFMIFVVPPELRLNVVKALTETGGSVFPCSFTEHGAKGWVCGKLSR